MQAGVPQCSDDGPLLFNLFVSDLPLFLTAIYLSNYADDNSLFKMRIDLVFAKEIFKKDFTTVIDWFYQKYVVLNHKNVIICVLAK